jgi:hypothetical protein
MTFVSFTHSDPERQREDDISSENHTAEAEDIFTWRTEHMNILCAQIKKGQNFQYVAYKMDTSISTIFELFSMP